jgi:para-aminobenzoate synthetase
VESKPIKGTARRDLADIKRDEAIAAQLQSDEKSRAENLMIVDLVRNDLGRVCQVGSVRVPNIMEVETYASVHQLVSTITGRLRPSCNVIDAIVATFPGGSMTGAPKKRTMGIIDSIEGRPRGIYSGAIGYIGSNNVMDLSIVIRTAVMTGDNITVSAGGAIVAMSDPEAEVEEVLLKATAVASAINCTISFKP